MKTTDKTSANEQTAEERTEELKSMAKEWLEKSSWLNGNCSLGTMARMRDKFGAEATENAISDAIILHQSHKKNPQD